MHKLKFSFIRPVRILFATFLLAGTNACTTITEGPSDRRAPGIASASADEKAMVHTQLARGYMQQNQLATAKTELDRALDISPSHSDSNYVMALLMMRLEQYDIAETHFSKAVDSDRNNSAAAHDFGTFLCQTGKLSKSVEYFDIAASNPLFAQAKLSYARAGQCIAPSNPERAEAYLTKALQIDSRLRPALFSLAELKYKSQQLLSARAFIERYLAITDPQPGALMLAYKIESSLKANDQAAQYRKQILTAFPGSRQANELRAKSRS